MKKKYNNNNSIDPKKNSSIHRSRSKKTETTRVNVVNPLRNSNQISNSRYKISKNQQNELATSSKNVNSGISSSKQVKVNSSTHVVISSIDVDYSKLVEEDQKRIDELKEKLVNQKLLLEKNKKELNEIKEKNDKMKDNIYQKNKELDKIKAEKRNYENLNNNITQKITEITQTIQEQRQRQINMLQRREIMMNYLMSMLMGLRQREENYPNVDNMSYEELLALEERMGNVSKGLTKEQIDKLPRDKFSKSKYADDKCIICQYEFKNYEKVIALSCKHCFHPDCIEEWLKNQKVCPYCKSEVKA
jgi:E3 ubiquitin-protein ligase BIG BROTHER-like protein